METATQFKVRVAALVNLEDVRDEMTLAEIGVDSLNIVELILAAEELFNRSVDPTQLEMSGFTTVGDFISMIEHSPATANSVAAR
jgi:acyl carrier protein